MLVEKPTISYHRNGIAGAGFHVINFTYHEHQMAPIQGFIGVVFEDSGYVAVINPNNPEDKYRGDVFEPELRAAIEKHYKGLGF